jgi:hypothetical protein
MNAYRVTFEKDIRWHLEAESLEEAAELAVEQMEQVTRMPRDILVRPLKVEVFGEVEFIRPDPNELSPLKK